MCGFAGYSLLGASYEFFLSIEKPSPPYADYMYFTSRIGLAASLVYQLAFVVPDWDHMVSKPLAATGVSAWGLATILVGFGGLYNLHHYCTAELFKTEGAVAVNLANACRWAITHTWSYSLTNASSSLCSSSARPRTVGCVRVCVCVCVCARDTQTKTHTDTNTDT